MNRRRSLILVSHTPGIELIMEAYEGYWRKVPSVKRLVFKSVPESTTRAAMLKRGEVDIAYLLDVPQAQEVKRDPNLKLAFSGGIAVFFLDYLEQWDPKSPWNDRRVRLAANYAIDRKTLSDIETLGASKPAGNFVPRTFEFALPIDPYPPIYEYIWPSGVGPRVEQPVLMLIAPYPWSAPLEDVRLKKL